MVTCDPTTIARERNIAEVALTLFCSVYGLTWTDSYRAAEFSREYGQAMTARVLRVVSDTGCSFLMALLACGQADGQTYTAPLNGKQPRMVEVH